MTLGIIIFVLLGLVAIWKGARVLYRSSADLQARREADRIDVRKFRERAENERVHLEASLLRGRLIREYVKAYGEMIEQTSPRTAILTRGMAHLEERVERIELALTPEPKDAA